MESTLTPQERLKDLRVVNKKLTLEQLSEQTGLSRSALGKYETDDFKDISPFAIATLAKFYDVSTDYLMGLTENKNHPNTELQALHLSDDMIDVLTSGKINNRLLCELAIHEGFQQLMTDIEIYVDRIADMRLHDLNTILEAVRQEVIQRYAPEKNDLHLRTLELAQVQEDDFFCHTIHNDIDRIIKDIRDAHLKDRTTADSQLDLDEIKQGLTDTINLSGSEDALIRVFCEQMDIPYDKLTSEEFTVFMRILSKSNHLKNSKNMRGKTALYQKHGKGKVKRKRK